MLGGASVIYRFFYWVLRGFHATFFRAIYVIGEQKPKWDKPNFVASTHPNSFLDAVLFADSVKPVMHFLARGDVFKKGFVNWLFIRQFNMIPIYRRRETANSEHKNKNVFRWVYRLLGENANIMIFTEGLSIPEKRMRPLKKGTAWMAFGAMEDRGADFDMHIVPVGLNYQDHHMRHQVATVIFAEPIRVADYWEAYQQSHAEGVKQLTDEIDRRLKENMVIIAEPEAEALGLPLTEIAHHDAYQPSIWWLHKEKAAPHFHAEQAAANRTNQLYAEGGETYSQWEAKAKTYTQHLKDLRLKDVALSPGQALRGWEKALLFLGWPIFLLGQIITLAPREVGKAIVTKQNMLGSQWYLSIWYGIEWIFFSILYFIALGLTFNLAGSLWGWLAVPGILMVATSSERYLALFIRARLRYRWRRLAKRQPEAAKQLQGLRQELARLGRGEE